MGGHRRAKSLVRADRGRIQARCFWPQRLEAPRSRGLWHVLRIIYGIHGTDASPRSAWAARGSFTALEPTMILRHTVADVPDQSYLRTTEPAW